ncbi:MAG: hypothetical protein MJE77_19450 [Proteobacteria bacterium]|nr:hypothetical protein [Pseudomonadota bacterium]
MSSSTCLEIPALPDAQSLTLPGGVTIEQIDLLDVVQPALTPLVPLFHIVDAVVAVQQCVQAIPDALGPPPDPSVLSACLPELAEKVSKLLQLVPQLSLPRTIVGTMDLLLDALRDARSALIHLQQQSAQLAGAVDRAAELSDPALLSIAECAQANIEQEAANTGKRLASLGKLIGLLNLFLGMIGAPEIPDLSELSGRPLDEVIEPLDRVVEVLRNARAAVPI